MGETNTSECLSSELFIRLMQYVFGKTITYSYACHWKLVYNFTAKLVRRFQQNKQGI